MASTTARTRSKSSEAPSTTKRRKTAQNSLRRIPVNPFILQVPATSRENAILDLGSALIRDIIGTSDDMMGVFVQTYFHNIDRELLELNGNTIPEVSIEEGNVLIPPQELSLQMSERAYNACYRLHEIIPMEDFQAMVTALYKVSPQEYGLDEYDIIALLFAVLALSFTLDAQSHYNMTCTVAIEKRYVR